MRPYRLMYSQTSLEHIRSLHPLIKSVVKTNIQKLKENPFLGKALEKELSGYYSLGAKRFRIIYRLDHEQHVIEIHYVGPRKDIYELFRERLPKA